MRKFAVLTLFGVVSLVGAAQAHPGHPAKSHPMSYAARAEGYNASGALVMAALSPAAGHHRYSGTIEVNMTRANHRAAKGDQTFTLTDARVVFHHGVSATAPAAGSRVGLHGKITELPKGCSTTGFTPTITVRDVDIRNAKPVKP